MALALNRMRLPLRTVLTFHELFPEPGYNRYAMSCRQFELNVELVSKINQQGPGDHPALVVSLDDGHVSNYLHALPVLEKYDTKATFFVIAGYVGMRKDFMSWTQLQELVSRGHRVESHSWSHKFLTNCHGSELRDELIRSRETLEDRLRISVRALSVPHGRWNRRVLNACGDAGYSSLYTSDPWSSSHASEQVNVIGRLTMVQSMDTSRLLRWLTMGPLEAGTRKVGNVLKRSVRRGLGTKIYYPVWARLSGRNGADH